MPDPRASLKTFLIADVRGYTSFTWEHGDEAAASLVEAFARQTEEVVTTADGSVIEFRGDEVLAVFDSPRAAIRAAVDLQTAYVSTAGNDEPIPVGIGLDVGEAVRVGDGYRGGALHIAARLCGLAGAGEILATQEVRHLTGPVEDVTFEDRGGITMKNVPEPVHVVRVVPPGEDPREVIKPVAGTGAGPLRVVIADDSLLFREGVARVLLDNGFAITDQVNDGDALLASIERETPDVVVTDIRMPPTHTSEGLVAAQKIRSEHPDVGVLVLSQYVETRHAIRLLQETPERVGYLLKDRVADIDDFADAIRRVARGGSAIDPEVVAELLGRRTRHGSLQTLTAREQEILALMAEGRSNQAICERLFLSPKTVETHIGSIFSKLGFEPAGDDHRRVLAVVMYLQGG
jgi:DNA-binding NarL/FixJ family response regulator/class 3 adenylate cyclase